MWDRSKPQPEVRLTSAEELAPMEIGPPLNRAYPGRIGILDRHARGGGGDPPPPPPPERQPRLTQRGTRLRSFVSRMGRFDLRIRRVQDRRAGGTFMLLTATVGLGKNAALPKSPGPRGWQSTESSGRSVRGPIANRPEPPVRWASDGRGPPPESGVGAVRAESPAPGFRPRPTRRAAILKPSSDSGCGQGAISEVSHERRGYRTDVDRLFGKNHWRTKHGPIA